ncbi:MAG: PBP1A family penicillin-binding protein [Thermodesulfobacteriota bacterium]
MAPKRKISWLYLTALVLAGALTGLSVGLVLAIGVGLPEIEGLEDFEPSAATRIMSGDGRVLAELYVEKRLPLSLEAVPLELRQAVVAVEDRRYYRHPGLDLIRNVAALLHDLMAGKMEQGASTITQQLARNLFLTRAKTIPRKLKEIFLALLIERRYTKDEILKLYLNQVYLGAGAYGVGAAADIYFHKDPSALDLSECALLAGLPQAPEGYNPFKHPQRALARRRVVLQAMVRSGYLTALEAEKAAKAPLRLAEPRSSGPGPAPHFVNHVKDLLFEKLQLDENQVYKGGLTVETTLDLALQKAAREALKQGLARMNERPGPRPQGHFGPIKEEVQGALVAVEVGSGAVLAWVGGDEDRPDSADRVVQAWRPPGSALVPLLYAAAVESGLTQADRVLDAPQAYQLPDRAEPWTPQNFSRQYEGEMTLRRALETSANVPAVKVLSRIGLDNFVEAARKVGITTPFRHDLTLALGVSEMNLLELVSAYGSLADRGIWSEPYAVPRVLDRTGRVIYRAAPRRRAALSPETAYILTDMLQGVIRNGTAQRAAVLGRPLAGETGRTLDNQDTWFIGYSPEVAAGVWMGYDSRLSLAPGESPARTALPVWMDFMREVVAGRPARDFERPIGVQMAPMDRYTGAPAEPGEPGYVLAAFRAGTEPR